MLDQISDDDLRQLYWTEGKSGREIAKIVGCSASLVCMRMKASGIPARKSYEYPPTEKQLAVWRANALKIKKTEKDIDRFREMAKRSKGKRKSQTYEFGGHEKKRTDGYVKVYVPDHPHATKDGYVMKHILVMEREIGRYLERDEVVHHINHVRDDNRIDNLRLMTKHDHMSMHMKERNALRRKNAKHNNVDGPVDG